jgi:hypothetical protein
MPDPTEVCKSTQEKSRVVIRLDTGVAVDSGPSLAELHRRGRASAQLAWIGREQLAFLVEAGFVERLPLLNIEGRYYFEAEVPDSFQNDLFLEHSTGQHGPATKPSVEAEAASAGSTTLDGAHELSTALDGPADPSVEAEAASAGSTTLDCAHELSTALHGPAAPSVEAEAASAGSPSLDSAHDLLAESLRMVQDVVDEVGGHLSSSSDARNAIRVVEERRGIKAKPVLVFMFQAIDELRYEVDDEPIFVRKPTSRAAAAYKDEVNLSVKLAPARAAGTVMEAEITRIGDASKWGESRGKDYLRFVGLEDWKLATLYLCRAAEHEISLWARSTTSMRTLKDQPADVVQEPDWLVIGQIALEALGNRLTEFRRAQVATVAANNPGVLDDRSAA